MKSYYSVSLVVIFAFVMSIMAVVHDAIQRQEISTADAAVITKADAASADQLAAARQWIAGLRPELPCFLTDLKREPPTLRLQDLISCAN